MENWIKISLTALLKGMIFAAVIFFINTYYKEHGFGFYVGLALIFALMMAVSGFRKAKNETK